MPYLANINHAVCCDGRWREDNNTNYYLSRPVVVRPSQLACITIDQQQQQQQRHRTNIIHAFMPSRYCSLLLLFFLLGLSLSSETSRSRSIQRRKGGLVLVEVGGASRVTPTPTPSTSRSDHRLHHHHLHHICFCCFRCRILEERVQKRQSLLRMRSLLLATRSNYCAGFSKGRLSSIMNHPSPSLSSAATASSSSALFAAPSSTITTPENEDGTKNRNNEGSTMHHLLLHKNQQSPQLQQTQQQYRPLVIVIAGPTAVGKSDVASMLCSTNMARDIMQSHFANYNHCHSIPSSESSDNTTVDIAGGNPCTTSTTTMIRGHVISADSVQVYRGNIDIGSNKPSAEELMKTPYHLVGIVDPPKATTTSSPTAMTSSMTSATLDATTVANTAISSSPTPPSTAAYGAADWMRDVMYVLRSLPTMANNNNHKTAITNNDDEDNRPEYKNENNDDSATYDNGALIRRREYIDRDLHQNLHMGASSSTTTLDNDKLSLPTPSSSTTTPPSASSPMIILPVVTGGTMMYLQWLVHGRPDAVRPTEDAAKRAADTINNFRRRKPTSGRRSDDDNKNVALHSNHDDYGDAEAKEADMDEDQDSNRADASCWEAASNYVSSLGPVFAKRVEKLPGRDWYRLRRLLEVAYTMSSTKKRKSNNNEVNAEDNLYSEHEILQQFTEKEIYTGIRSGSLADSGYDVRCFFLCPTDRMTHFHAVDLRCEQMLLRGLLRECADLYITGVLQTESMSSTTNSQVSRAIGYRQTLEYLTRKGARGNDGPALLAFIDDFATATRQYAKKQMQWFRREKDFAFIPVNMDVEKDERVARTAQLIADMCKLHPLEFDSELSPETPSLSTQTRLENERQGKGMKYFHSKRVLLKDGSDEFIKVMAEADVCTRLVQGLGEHF